MPDALTMRTPFVPQPGSGEDSTNIAARNGIGDSRKVVEHVRKCRASQPVDIKDPNDAEVITPERHPTGVTEIDPQLRTGRRVGVLTAPGNGSAHISTARRENVSRERAGLSLESIRGFTVEPGYERCDRPYPDTIRS